MKVIFVTVPWKLILQMEEKAIYRSQLRFYRVPHLLPGPMAGKSLCKLQWVQR